MGDRKPPGRPKGTPKTGGRKKGVPNKATVEAKQACAEIVDDPHYRARLVERARAGTLAPAVETMRGIREGQAERDDRAPGPPRHRRHV